VLYEAELERRFAAESAAQARDGRAERNRPTQFQIVVTAMVGVAALCVVVASVRLTDQAVYRSVEAREAPERFLADQLSTLRVLAMTSESVVPGRLYLGIEQCFQDGAPVPFDEAAARSALDACAESEIGRLQAQRGPRAAEEGVRVLRDAGINGIAPR
jgi:hypothetical protein